MEKQELIFRSTTILNHLKVSCQYKQNQIAKKIKSLGIKISTSTISNLKNRPKEMGVDQLLLAHKGLEGLLRRDFCLCFDPQLRSIVAIKDCIIDVIQDDIPSTNTDGLVQKDYVIHHGRIPVSRKVELYESAKVEIIEVGIRLKRFNEYFTAKREDLFKGPILARLQAGVKMRCFVADPDKNNFKDYIRRMSAVNKKENQLLTDIHKNHAELVENFKTINQQATPGKMELYKYTCAPVFHAAVVDPELETGKMFFSPYLYGLNRVDCPVLEIPKKGNKTLFKNCWKSIKSVINPDPISKEKVIDILNK